jgi:RHS repeat-associated protein
LRLPGQYYTAETGLNQNVNRDYDPLVGKYVESDPIGLKGGINTYRYAADRPVATIDPTGLVIRGTGLTDDQWNQVQAAESAIRGQLSKACSCQRDGSSSCIPCDLVSKLTSVLGSSTVNFAEMPGYCGSGGVGGNSLKLSPQAFTSPGCQCLAVTLYHELLHNAGLSHNDPGDPVTALDKQCRGNLCALPEIVVTGIR